MEMTGGKLLRIAAIHGETLTLTVTVAGAGWTRPALNWTGSVRKRPEQATADAVWVVVDGSTAGGLNLTISLDTGVLDPGTVYHSTLRDAQTDRILLSMEIDLEWDAGRP